jgi:type IV pilus assembly protein PilC
MKKTSEPKALVEKADKPESFTSLKALFKGSLSKADLVMFAKRLAFLMRAGVPILEALTMLAEQTKTQGSKEILNDIVKDVANGHFLANAMEKHAKVFGEFTVNIVRVGEQGGILADNLNYLAEELKKKQALRKKVMSALFYPMFIVVATLIMALILTVVVFPKVLPIFTSINVPLPATTRSLMFFSHFLIHQGWLLFLAVVALVVGFLAALKNIKFRTFLDALILKLPLGGSIAQSYYLANFARTMGLLLKGEARLNEALNTSAATTENLIYKQEFLHLKDAVNRGEKISEYMKQNPKHFPAMVGHMLAVGERAGNLSGSFLYLAEMYEADVEDITINLSSLIEPVRYAINRCNYRNSDKTYHYSHNYHKHWFY